MIILAKKKRKRKNNLKVNPEFSFVAAPKNFEADVATNFRQKFA